MCSECFLRLTIFLHNLLSQRFKPLASLVPISQNLYLWCGLFSAALPSLVMILTMTHPHVLFGRIFPCYSYVHFRSLVLMRLMMSRRWSPPWQRLPGDVMLGQEMGKGGEAAGRGWMLLPIQPPVNILHNLQCWDFTFWFRIHNHMYEISLNGKVFIYFPSSSPNTIHCRCPLSSRPIGPNMESDPGVM